MGSRLAKMLVEVRAQRLLDDEEEAREAGQGGIVEGVVEEGLAARADGRELLEAAEPRGAAGREDDEGEGWIQDPSGRASEVRPCMGYVRLPSVERCKWTYATKCCFLSFATPGRGGFADEAIARSQTPPSALELSRVSRKVLITGGAGFIGSHVARAHIARGDRVWIVDDLSAGRPANVPARAELIEVDIADPRARDLIRDVRFDLINHHAAQIDVRASVADPIADAKVNIAGLINILEGARDAGTRRVVFVSSGGVVYGEPEVYPTPEGAPKRPASPYGVSKLAGEYYLDYYREVHGLDYVALRYGNVYGPGQDPHGEAGVAAIFCNRLIDGQPLDIYGDGEQTRDYVYVEDVAAANLIAADMPLEDDAGIDARAFNVGTGEATSVSTLATLLEEIAGIRPGRIHREGRPGELRHSVLSTARIRAMGWSPAHALREGLARTFRHIASERAATPLRSV